VSFNLVQALERQAKLLDVRFSGRLELVAPSRQGDNHLWLPKVVSQFSPQAVNVHLEDVGSIQVLFSPDLLYQSFPRDSPARVAYQFA